MLHSSSSSSQLAADEKDLPRRRTPIERANSASSSPPNREQYQHHNCQRDQIDKCWPALAQAKLYSCGAPTMTSRSTAILAANPIAILILAPYDTLSTEHIMTLFG